jgi:hypothetical protein
MPKIGPCFQTSGDAAWIRQTLGWNEACAISRCVRLLNARANSTVPLQASDLFAWCIRAGTNIGTSGERPFEWLLPELNRVYQSEYSQYYDEERLTALMQDVEQQANEIRTDLNPASIELYEKYRDLWER